ncbi:MAG: cysteine desulfurase [Phycisphaerales bacterium]
MTNSPPAIRNPASLFRLREDFPILRREVNGRPVIYLDNAATTQKPSSVLDAVENYYTNHNANVHRGVHTLSAEATEAYELARSRMRRFINAADDREIVFTRGTTESINLVAQSFLAPKLEPGDEVLVTTMEHHSNIVPWQLVCERAGARVVPAPMSAVGELDLDGLRSRIADRTRLIAFVHASNALGTINPAAAIVNLARERGIPTLIDGAQAAPHLPIDVQKFGCDFYAISGHKMYGPTGIGVLYGRRERLDAMPPYQGGGEMIRSVSFEGTTYADSPARFEAGTPNISGAIGLAAAIDYLDGIDREALLAHEHELLMTTREKLRSIPGVRLIGEPRDAVSVVSFVVDGIHPHDLGTILDHFSVAVRTGHHCTQPVMDFYGVPATARASFGLYNTLDEVDALVEAVQEAIKVFRA